MKKFYSFTLLNFVVSILFLIGFISISQSCFALCTGPTAQSFGITVNGSTISWVNGNGGGRVVYINTVNTFTAPVNGTNPVASSVYTSGQRCVYNGTSNTVFVTGLTKGTSYYIRIYEYCNPDRVYNTEIGTNNPLSFVSCPVSPALTIIPAGGTTTVCPGSSVSIGLAANSGYSSYLWSTGATTASITATSAATYSVTVTASNACTSQARISINTAATCNFTLINTFYLQGPYLGGGVMNAILDPVNKPTVCDSVTISLARGVAPYDILYTTKSVVSTTGTCVAAFSTSVPYANYYIVLKHRNSMQTWSKTPICIVGSSMSYDWKNSNYTENPASGNFAFNAGHTCKTILNQYPASTSGVYWVDPDDAGFNPPFQAYCDMTTSGGGWTLVAQHTTSATPSFGLLTYAQATSLAIQKSTGSLAPKTCELWVGLGNWNLIGNEMLLTMNSLTYPGINHIAKWSQFSVNPYDKFRLSIGGFSTLAGSIGDDWSIANGVQFSTFDSDNDQCSCNCVSTYRGMGWHTACFQFKLFGENGGSATSYADGGPISQSLTGYYVGLGYAWWGGIWLR